MGKHKHYSYYLEHGTKIKGSLAHKKYGQTFNKYDFIDNPKNNKLIDLFNQAVAEQTWQERETYGKYLPWNQLEDDAYSNYNFEEDGIDWDVIFENIRRAKDYYSGFYDPELWEEELITGDFDLHYAEMHFNIYKELHQYFGGYENYKELLDWYEAYKESPDMVKQHLNETGIGQKIINNIKDSEFIVNQSREKIINKIKEGLSNYQKVKFNFNTNRKNVAVYDRNKKNRKELKKLYKNYI